MGYFEAQNHSCDLLALCSCLDFLRNLLSKYYHLLKLVVLEVEEIVNLTLWDHQCVAFSQWSDVEECVELLVLSNLVAWDFASYNS